MIAFTRPSTTAMISSGSGPLAEVPVTTCVATQTAIATTMVWTRNPALFRSAIASPPAQVTPNSQLPTLKALPTPNSQSCWVRPRPSWESGVGSALVFVLGSWHFERSRIHALDRLPPPRLDDAAAHLQRRRQLAARDRELGRQQRICFTCSNCASSRLSASTTSR